MAEEVGQMLVCLFVLYQLSSAHSTHQCVLSLLLLMRFDAQPHYSMNLVTQALFEYYFCHSFICVINSHVHLIFFSVVRLFCSQQIRVTNFRVKSVSHPALSEPTLQLTTERETTALPTLPLLLAVTSAASSNIRRQCF